MRDFPSRLAQPPMALAGLAAEARATTSVMPRTHPRPGARWLALGKRVIAVPMSASRISAVRGLTPLIGHSPLRVVVQEGPLAGPLRYAASHAPRARPCRLVSYNAGAVSHANACACRLGAGVR